MSETVVIVSGGFDPIHEGHLDLWEAAKALGDKLVIIVNSDSFLRRKKGFVFWTLETRCRVASKWADSTFIAIDEDQTVCETLEVVARIFRGAKLIFANGGDRKSESDIPEAEICKSLGIEMKFGVGGSKKGSSTALVLKAFEDYMRERR